MYSIFSYQCNSQNNQTRQEIPLLFRLKKFSCKLLKLTRYLLLTYYYRKITCSLDILFKVRSLKRIKIGPLLGSLISAQLSICRSKPVMPYPFISKITWLYVRNTPIKTIKGFFVNSSKNLRKIFSQFL